MMNSLLQSKRILVVHQGKRDQYQLAAAMALAGAETTLVTSGYGTVALSRLSKLLPFNGLIRLAARRSRELDRVVVDHCNLLEVVLATLVKHFSPENLGHEVLDWSIARRAKKRLKIGHYDAVICYNYNAFRVFAEMAPLGTRRVLFQCHPHPAAVRSVLDAEIAAGKMPYFNHEREYSYSPPYIGMLYGEAFLASRILCASSFTKTGLIAIGIKPESIDVVPYGIETNHKPANRKLRVSGSPIKILFVGQFAHRKGLATITEIVNRLAIPIDITFVGRGAFEYDPRSGITNMGARVTVIRDAPFEDLQRAYETSEIFLFPSLMEGFAQVILEAMAAGCIPVVSTSTCGPDIIEHGKSGFFFAPNDISGFVGAIEAIANETDLTAMSNYAFQAAAAMSWGKFREHSAIAVAKILED